MKRKVGILIFDQVEVLDFAGPFEVFSVASQVHDYELFDVVLIAKELKPVVAVNGLSVNPHYSFDDAPALDILIIAGGSGTRPLLKDQALLEWVKKNHSTCEITMSICSGARVLAILGLLDNKPYCTHQGVYNHMSKLVPSGLPQYKKRFTESSAGLFTSGGISAGIDLSFHVISRISKEGVVEATAGYMEYDLKKY